MHILESPRTPNRDDLGRNGGSFLSNIVNQTGEICDSSDFRPLSDRNFESIFSELKDSNENIEVFDRIISDYRDLRDRYLREHKNLRLAANLGKGLLEKNEVLQRVIDELRDNEENIKRTPVRSGTSATPTKYMNDYVEQLESENSNLNSKLREEKGMNKSLRAKLKESESKLANLEIESSASSRLLEEKRKECDRIYFRNNCLQLEIKQANQEVKASTEKITMNDAASQTITYQKSLSNELRPNCDPEPTNTAEQSFEKVETEQIKDTSTDIEGKQRVSFIDIVVLISIAIFLWPWVMLKQVLSLRSDRKK